MIHNIGRVVNALLSPIVSGKVYALRAEANTQLPFLAYRRVGLSRFDDLCKDVDQDQYEIDIQISIYATSYPESAEIMRKVIAAMRDIDLPRDIAGIIVSDIDLIDGEEDCVDDGDIFVQTLIFKIR